MHITRFERRRILRITAVWRRYKKTIDRTKFVKTQYKLKSEHETNYNELLSVNGELELKERKNNLITFQEFLKDQQQKKQNNQWLSKKKQLVLEKNIQSELTTINKDQQELELENNNKRQEKTESSFILRTKESAKGKKFYLTISIQNIRRKIILWFDCSLKIILSHVHRLLKPIKESELEKLMGQLIQNQAQIKDLQNMTEELYKKNILYENVIQDLKKERQSLKVNQNELEDIILTLNAKLKTTHDQLDEIKRQQFEDQAIKVHTEIQTLALKNDLKTAKKSLEELEQENQRLLHSQTELEKKRLAQAKNFQPFIKELSSKNIESFINSKKIKEFSPSIQEKIQNNTELTSHGSKFQPQENKSSSLKNNSQINNKSEGKEEFNTEEETSRRKTNKKSPIKTSQSNNRKKRTGKPPGRKGGGRKRPSDLNVYDTVRTIFPTVCQNPKCRHVIPKGVRNHDYYTRHVIDVIQIHHGLKYVIELYKVYRKYCPECNKLISARYLVPTYPKYIFGYGYMAYALMKRISLRGLLEYTTKEIGILFGEEQRIADETLLNWLKKTGDVLGPALDDLKRELKKDQWIKIDETGMPLDGKKGWMWVFCSTYVRIFVASPSRAHQVPKKILEGYDGWIMSDFFSAYSKLPQTKTKCHIHLNRDLVDIVKRNFRIANKIESKILESKDSMKPSNARRGQKAKKPKNYLNKTEIRRQEIEMRNLRAEAELTLKLYYFLCNQDKDDYSLLECRETFDAIVKDTFATIPESFLDLTRILKRIDKYWDDLFRYKLLPPEERHKLRDNNLAEATVKSFAGLRRTHGTWRSEVNAEAIAICLSFCETKKINNLPQNDFLFWIDLIKGDLTTTFSHLSDLTSSSPQTPFPINSQISSVPC
ncbi:transposase [Candidatus Woesearchaeota archaeon]|nr:transposase [Candidatus Woesearchaeota archaeon]